MMLKTDDLWPGSRPNEPASSPAHARAHQGNGVLHAVSLAGSDPFPPVWLADVALDDWDALFDAVKMRLTQLATGRTEPSATGPGGDTAGDVARLRGDVLECVAALNQLHTTLTHEDSRRGELNLR